MSEMPIAIDASDPAVIRLLNVYHSAITRDNGAPNRHITQSDMEGLLNGVSCENRFACANRGYLSQDCYILEKDACPHKDD